MNCANRKAFCTWSMERAILAEATVRVINMLLSDWLNAHFQPTAHDHDWTCSIFTTRSDATSFTQDGSRRLCQTNTTRQLRRVASSGKRSLTYPLHPIYLDYCIHSNLMYTNNRGESSVPRTHENHTLHSIYLDYCIHSNLMHTSNRGQSSVPCTHENHTLYIQSTYI